MTYVKTYLSTFKTHVENLKRDVRTDHVTSSGSRFAVNSDLKLSNNSACLNTRDCCFRERSVLSLNVFFSAWCVTIPLATIFPGCREDVFLLMFSSALNVFSSSSALSEDKGMMLFSIGEWQLRLW